MPAKRRRLDASPAGSAAATAGPRRPLFVIAPAAFGKLPANKVGKPPVSPATHLALLGDVLVCENPDKLDTLPVGIRGKTALRMARVPDRPRGMPFNVMPLGVYIVSRAFLLPPPLCVAFASHHARQVRIHPPGCST